MKKTILFLCVALFCATHVWADRVEIDGVYYNLDRNSVTAQVTNGDDKYSGSVVFPDSVTYGASTYSVTSIGSFAFEGCTGLTSITIPNSVTSIGDWAFLGCSSLTSITIPNSVTSIGSFAFEGCTGLTSITLPNSVQSIGYRAFEGCTGLTSITLPNSVTSIGNSAFWLCTGLTSITIPNSVTSIGNSAFSGCTGLTSITIPNGVTSIGSSAFSGCSSLTSVTIPNSVTSIGSFAFCDVPNIVYSGTATGAPWGARSLNGYVEGNLVYRDSTKTELLACSAAATGEITIPNTVTSIGYWAFENCSKLTSVMIGNSVTSIGKEAFSGCSSLTSITIPNSVTSIGNNVFSGCNLLFSVIDNIRYVDTYLVEAVDKTLSSYKIKEGTRFIGRYAFSDCSNLTSIRIPNSVTSIEHYAFSSGTSLTSVMWNAKNCNAYNFGSQVESFVFGDEVEVIPNGLCKGMNKLTSITIPNSVTSIGDYAFNGCTGLTSITLPNSVQSIGYRAFYDCDNLKDIFVPCGELDRFKKMDGADSRMKYIPSSYTLTGKSAANGYVFIPAYSSCDESITITARPNRGFRFVKWSDGNTDNPRTVYLTEDQTFEANFDYALTGKCGEDSLLIWTLDTATMSLTISGNGALSKNYTYGSFIESITIGDDVTTIGDFAFESCRSLTSITIPNSVTSIGRYAFYGCSSLEDIFVPCGELERFTQMFNDSYNSDYSDKLKIASSPHTLTIKDTKYGTVSVPDYNGCDESVMITAIPDPHCRFVKWSDGNTDNPRPVYLTEDITLEALFVYTLTDKCGKDYLLTWTLDTLKMAMDITGKGSLSDNYTYHTTFATLTIGNEVTTIGANAFSDCDNLQYLTLGSSVRVIESGAFACSDIKTITCYNKRPPTVNNDAFCNLDYETIIYVPKDYLENYQMHAFWGMFDVRPIGASGTETDKVKVEPAETTATVAWPTISGAGSYELVIRDKDGNALCTLVFNAQGQLTSIDFAAAPARDRSNVAAMAQGAGFAFTVTGLESGTMYKYSFITKNASGAVIDTKTGAFTTQSPTALEDIMDDASSSVRKVLQNGQLYILRDGKVYNATGAEVK